ncbi:unnamed protein product [Discosporangium mesarthrocarpum]
MVIFESLCALTFFTATLVCLTSLVLPWSDQPDVFVAILLLSCALGALAVFNVKGKHACWHPSAQVTKPPESETRCDTEDTIILTPCSERRPSFVEVALRVHG